MGLSDKFYEGLSAPVPVVGAQLPEDMTPYAGGPLDALKQHKQKYKQIEYMQRLSDRESKRLLKQLSEANEEEDMDKTSFVGSNPHSRRAYYMDKLAVEAEESYKNLMDLGMNVDSRYSGRIFEVAGNFLRNAIDAKSGKIDKKLKMIELQLKKQKLDQGNKDNTPMEESDGYVISDRNELMKKLLKKD